MIKGIPKEILDLCVVEKPHAYDHPEDFKIVGVKPQTQPCPDCGLIVKDRRISCRRSQSPIAHWRRACENCKMYQNPETGKYEVPIKDAQPFFKAYFKNQTK